MKPKNKDQKPYDQAAIAQAQEKLTHFFDTYGSGRHSLASSDANAVEDNLSSCMASAPMPYNYDSPLRQHVGYVRED
jgi:hypothetical protein